MPHYRSVIGVSHFVVTGILLVLSILFISAFHGQTDIEIGAIGSILTLIYGFFMHALFKFLEQKYLRFKELMGEMSGYLEAIYRLAQLTGDRKLTTRLRDAIEALTRDLTRLDPSEYTRTQHHIGTLYRALAPLRPRRPYQVNAHTRIIEHLGKISAAREKLELFGSRHIVGETKLVLLLATGLLIGMLIALSLLAHPFIVVITFTLIMLILFVTHLMFAMDTLSYGGSDIRERNLGQLRDQLRHAPARARKTS